MITRRTAEYRPHSTFDSRHSMHRGGNLCCRLSKSQPLDKACARAGLHRICRLGQGWHSSVMGNRKPSTAGWEVNNNRVVVYPHPTSGRLVCLLVLFGIVMVFAFYSPHQMGGRIGGGHGSARPYGSSAGNMPFPFWHLLSLVAARP